MDAGNRFRTYIVTANAFPKGPDRKERISQLVADASAGTTKGPRRLDRYKNETSYKKSVDHMVRMLLNVHKLR